MSITKSRVIEEAADLLGPERDSDNVNPEYTRAIVELTMRLIGANTDDFDKDEFAGFLRALAE